MHATPTPLDDAGLQRFLRDGYITLDAGLPADFHQRLYEEVDGVFESEGNPGNNILYILVVQKQFRSLFSQAGAENAGLTS